MASLEVVQAPVIRTQSLSEDQDCTRDSGMEKLWANSEIDMPTGRERLRERHTRAERQIEIDR